MKLHSMIQGEGRPLLIMHGLMGMLDNWHALAKAFAQHFEVHSLDLRNHGRSPHDSEISYAAMVADVIEYLDDHNLEHTNIIGHSMGGKVAMLLAQNHPNRVLKLVVADIGPKFYPVHHQDVLAALNAVPLGTLSRRTEAEPFMKPYLKEAGVRQFLLKSLYQNKAGAFNWRFNLKAISENIQLVGEAIDELDYDGETLFIRGSKSDYITDDDWADIKLIFPHAYLDEIEGAGHWLHAEAPEVFYDKVMAFLKG